MAGTTGDRPLSTDSVIPPEIIQAYLQTEYHVHGNPPLTLRIGEPNAGLAALHAAAGVDCSAFITAWNPLSQRLPDTENAARQDALAAELRRRGLGYLEGRGQHPVDAWGEASFLVPGLDLQAARALGSAYGQNALVWSGADAVPQLILLR